jgi:DnaJ-class molecular chaperone
MVEFTCPVCNGSGETLAPTRDPQDADPQRCTLCNGDGSVTDAELAAYADAYPEDEDR